jgi:SAM-dependent methyltransferase
MVDRRPNPLPGEWNLHLCASCEAAYLDPRPTRASIMRADPRRALPRRRGVLRAWIDRTAVALRNGFVATRTGHRLRPASRLGPVLYALRPWRARRALTQVAWLPSDRPGALLDVGADSALTVEAACSAGWSVSVVTVHRHPPSWLDGRGIAVHTGSVAEAGLAPRSFDLITVQGALERMHDPVAELGECARLLRPGGRLRVVAPNLRSAGHERFRRRWRIIDVPRTLIIPTPQALDALLRRAGFGAVAPASAPPRSGAGFHLVGRGGRRRRLDPRRVLRRAVMAASAAAADLRGLLRPARADFLARVAAPRPAGSPAAALAA